MTDGPLSQLDKTRRIIRELARQPNADEGQRLYTDRQIGHDEALEAAQRLINSHFDNPGPQARTSIPAEPDRDDDLVLCAYILQQRSSDVAWLSFDPISNVLTIDGFRISGEFLRQLTTSPCGIRFKVISRDGVITIGTERDPLEAAAPDLLAELKNIVPRFEACARFAGNSNDTIGAATEKAHAAIARAETPQ